MKMSKSNTEAINKRLQQEEEWLRQFESNVAKSARLRNSVETIIDKFHDRLTSLEQNVLPMHEPFFWTTKKMTDIQRLINTIDATSQFYGRTSELESSIRDGVASHNVAAYLEQMENLQQAVKFFETHKNYQVKSENMKMTMELGFTMLEKEYRNVILRNTLPADSNLLVDSLDEQYELLATRGKDIKTIKSLEEVVKLGVWLLSNGRSRFLSHFSEIRGENMLKAVNAIAQHHQALVAKTPSRTKLVNKRAGKGERAVKKEPELGGHAEEGALLVFGCFLALLEVEDSIMQRAIPDTSKRAQVFREVVYKPFFFVTRHVLRVVQDSSGGVVPLLPILRFLSAHQTRLHNLATNSTGEIPFENLVRQIRMNAVGSINEFVENLKNDADKFIPADGNVHPITPKTLNFLVTLTIHRHTVTQQVLSLTAAPNENQSLLLPKLFARILSALGTCICRKTENYESATLGQIFLLNNYNYIAKALSDEEDALLPVISEQNTQILSFYQAEISKCIQNYMHSWSSVVSTLKGLNRVGEDRVAARNLASVSSTQKSNFPQNFSREFDLTCSSQQIYCISDTVLAAEVRNKIKEAILPLYAQLTLKLKDMDRQIKYSENSLAIVIGRLFDNPA